MVEVIALVFHEYVVAPFAVNVAEPPVQIEDDEVPKFTVGVVIIFTITVFVELHGPLEPVAVYTVLKVGDTTLVEVRGPLLQV